MSRMRASSEITSIFDLESLARRRLPRVIFDYVHGGSYEQVTLARNRDDLRALELRQHVLRDVAHPRIEVQMVGDRAAIPLAIGPTGLAGLTWANGECEAARAARDFGIPSCLSTMSICSIEDVAEATGKPFWFQLYLMKSRKVNESLLRRAHDAGCAALVPTLDLRVQGKRWAVFFDGGIRTGADIVKAMGCGADACLTGRGYLYGLAARGYGGVKRALELLRDELRDCMALCGLNDVAAIPEGVVTGPSG